MTAGGDSGPRVAVVAYTEYPFDPRVRREAETLAAIGYDVSVLCVQSRRGASAQVLGGVKVHELPLQIVRGGKSRYAFQYVMFLLLSTALLVRLHMRNQFSIVHVHSLPDFQVFCALPLKVAGSKVLLDLHEALPEIVAARFHLPKKSFMFRLASAVEKFSCLFADRVVVANDGIRDALVSRGVPGERITAIYNGYVAPTGVPPAETIRAEFGLSNKSMIVHAGGVNPERDLETLLTALAFVLPRHEVQLVIAGDGDPQYVNSLKTLATRLGLSNKVSFTGRVAFERAQWLLSLAEIGVVTLEANPLTDLAWPSRIVEFAGLGKPLLLPKLLFIERTLGSSAQYYRPGDPASLAHELDAMLTHPEATREQARQAENVCRRFAWDAIRPIFVGICDELAKA